MIFFEWSDDYLTGIELIDIQHKLIFRLTSEVYDEISKPTPDNSAVSGLINSLIDYAEYHFKTEEKLFKESDYPEAQSHCAEHEIYREKIRSIMKEQESGKLNAMEIIIFLKEWLISHIEEVDQSYVPFIIQRGIT